MSAIIGKTLLLCPARVPRLPPPNVRGWAATVCVAGQRRTWLLYGRPGERQVANGSLRTGAGKSWSMSHFPVDLTPFADRQNPVLLFPKRSVVVGRQMLHGAASPRDDFDALTSSLAVRWLGTWSPK